MKILVTGAAGFIGFHLCKALSKNDCEVIGIDNINSYYDINLKYARLAELGVARDSLRNGILCGSSSLDNFKFVWEDIENYEYIIKLFEKEKFDLVVNLAAQAGVRYSLQNPHAYINSNVTGFLNILEASRQSAVRHLVYASSSSVYGSNTKMPFNVSDSVNHPVSVYAATKKANELLAHTYSHLYALPTTGLRFFTVYGPWGRPDMAPMLFADAIINGRDINIFNNGQMERDFTFIDDIVDGIIKVIERPAVPNKHWDSDVPNPSSSYAPFKIYNIGNSSPVRLLDFIESMEKALGVEAKKNFMPMQPGDVVATWADVQDLIEDTGYMPKTDIKSGVQQFVNWYLTYTNIR